MHIYEQKLKATPQNTPANSTLHNRSHFGQSREMISILNLKRTIGNQAVQRPLHTDVEGFKMNSATAPSPRFAHDFSRVLVVSGRTTMLGEAEEGTGPVSQSLDAGGPRDAGVSLPGGVPTPVPTFRVTPTASPIASCAIATRTLVAAPDGTPNTRKEVGVNEQVEMTASASVTWTASNGTFPPPASGATAIWTAPDVGATASVTATPASGNPCSVSMKVLPPARRSLVKSSDRAYTAGLAGSGFQAIVTIMPTNVSFTRIQVWEEAVNAIATGYYDTVLGWNGLPHPPTAPLIPDASNNGLIDTIGTNEPGSPGPFSVGSFLWAIPQHYRIVGSTGSIRYSTGNHAQSMLGPTGVEGTAKEGASRGRVP